MLNVLHRGNVACAEHAAGRVCHDAAHWVYSMQGREFDADALTTVSPPSAPTRANPSRARTARCPPYAVDPRRPRGAVRIRAGGARRVRDGGIHRTEVAAMRTRRVNGDVVRRPANVDS